MTTYVSNCSASCQLDFKKHYLYLSINQNLLLKTYPFNIKLLAPTQSSSILLLIRQKKVEIFIHLLSFIIYYLLYCLLPGPLTTTNSWKKRYLVFVHLNWIKIPVKTDVFSFSWGPRKRDADFAGSPFSSFRFWRSWDADSVFWLNKFCLSRSQTASRCRF